ncbi:MAG: glycosyltransferase family 4 protein [Sulfurospirillaceae bacterium]|nr:glycosyltransferase family 4 protein [Sulfurospirillaceae bacterium]
MIEVAVFCISVIATYLVRYIALKKKLLDMPNERSSHAVPTPRGGGLAIILAIAFGVFMVDKVSFLLPLLPLVIVSFLDDVFTISAKIRFAVQAFSALLALYFLGWVSHVDFGIFELHGAWLNIFAFLFLVWMTNLYNFLDGIDGYAGGEAVFVGMASFVLFDFRLGLIVALASFGFLLFNWHKASIFMGDVGSAPLGFLFAFFALSFAGTPYFVGWIVLLCLFWFDATITLYRRWRNGEKLSFAHKKHMYQRLSQSGWAHDKVVLSGMALNLVFFVILSFLDPSSYWVALTVAITLLFWALKFVDHRKAFV